MQTILSLIETLVRDLRYAVRTLRRDAALTTFAILIIGVGVGASTIVFSVVNALWLRPLPFDDPGRLVWVANGTSENLSRQAVQVGHLVDLRQQSQSLVGLAGFSPFYGVGDIRLTGARRSGARHRGACDGGLLSAAGRTGPGWDETSPPRMPLGRTKNSDPELRVLAAPPGREGRRARRADYPRWRTGDDCRRAAPVVRLRRHVFTRSPRQSVPSISAESRDESKG